VLEYYAGPRLHRIDGSRSVEEIHRALEQVLEARLAASVPHD